MRIKERIKDNKRLIAVFIIIAFIAGCAVVYLTSHDLLDNGDYLSEMNENRSRILVTGLNYSLNDEQEQNYLQEEQKKEEAEVQQFQQEIQKTENIEENSSLGADDTNGENGNHNGAGEENEGFVNGDDGQGENGEGDNVGGEDEESKLPSIKSSLSGITTVEGNFLTFSVEAVSYKKVKIKSFNLKVTANGSRLSSSGTDKNGVVTYRADGMLVDGVNEISVTATDEEGYTAAKTYVFNVDLNGKRPEGGTVKLVIDAPSIGLGTLYKIEEPFYEGENAASFIDRNLKRAGFAPQTTGTIAMGYYVARLNKPGISKGWEINAAVKKRLDEINADENGPPISENTLGEQDFYKYSGWVYAVNGVYPDGMATFNLFDGDEIRLSFTLWMGYEYDGTWPECNL